MVRGVSEESEGCVRRVRSVSEGMVGECEGVVRNGA